MSLPRRKSPRAAEVVAGFPPIVGAGARVLILGTMPSIASLERHEYYGNPRNAFWSLIGELFGIDARSPYRTRTAALAARGVAVWDVAKVCAREASADATIRDVEPNDFAGLFAAQVGIRAVFFNGRKAQELYDRLVRPKLAAPWASLPSHALPSTSPANAATSRADKLRQWRAVADALEC